MNPADKRSAVRTEDHPLEYAKFEGVRIEPAFLFDLDGTLVDSVSQHVLAWKEALDAEGIELSVWRIHRKIGMSGGLFTNQLLREGITSSSNSFSKRITS
jgi:hypothetical protein